MRSRRVQVKIKPKRRSESDGIAKRHCCPGNLFGGVERVLLTLAREGQATRFALCFDDRLARELRALGADVQILGEARFSRPWTILKARRALRKVQALQTTTEREDFVFHGCWTFAALAPGLKRGSRRILAIHDVPNRAHWSERLAKFAGPNAIVANSRIVADLADQAFGSPSAVVIAPPVPHSPKLSANERQKLRAKLKAGTEPTVILMASRWEPMKGHAVLIEALGRLQRRDDWRAWIAGGPQRDWERVFASQIRAFCRALGIADRVAFLGPRDDVPALMQAADLYCQPNLSPEGFGIAFVEAMRAGLPVVTSRLGGALELIDDSRGVLVPPANPSALAEAIAALLDDPDRRQALGRAGRDWSLGRFDPSRIGQQWGEL